MNSEDSAIRTRALHRWLEIQGELLRGVAHAMSNRIGTLSAGLFMLDSNRDNTRAVDALRAEVERLEGLLLQLRQLPRAPESLEPMLATDVARNAIELHSHHGDLRHVSCTLEDPGAVPPVRADPQALLHALLVAITAAKQAATTDTVSLRLSSNDDYVTFNATAGDNDMTDSRFSVEAAAITELLAPATSVRATAHSNGCKFEVPTLAASRRAQG